MPRIQPFTGLVYAPSAGDPTAVTAPPYDAITDDERRDYLAANPHNVVRLILSREEDCSPGEDPYGRAGRLFREWREAGILVETPEPSLFVYEMVFDLGAGPRRVRGVMAAIDLEPFGAGIVPHERTMPGPVEDRLRLVRATRANLSPVYTVLRGPNEPHRDLVERATSGTPDVEATDPSGVVHRMWIRPGMPEGLAEAYAEDSLLIADGHHRYTTALAYRDEMRVEHGPGPWDAALLLVVDAGEDPPVLPIHRVVRRADVPAPGFEVGSLEEAQDLMRDEELRFGVATHTREGLTLRVAELDGGEPPTVVALHERILARYPEAEVTYVADPVRVLEEVATGATAYLLPPTHVDRIRAVIERGDRLPQKSTWFWPKPRTGMVIRAFD